MPNSIIDDLAFAYGKPECTGTIRSIPEDFVVDEILGFEPDGEGEHILLQIRKRNTNTEWLARQISQFASIKQMDVSYAGLKDRNAVTTQWFSVRLAGKEEPDWSELNSDEITVMQSHHHRRKLRKGALKANRFQIVIRDIVGDYSEIEDRLGKIKQNGVPNYFGEQRFGIDGGNINQAEAMFSGKRIKSRHKRSLYLSAARSYLFNQHLSRRVADQNWNRAIPGDAMILSGSHSYFIAETIDTEIERRVAEFDIHPSGVLWGRGSNQSTVFADAAIYEKELADKYQLFCEGLEKAGLDHARRSLRLIPENFTWKTDKSNQRLTLNFELPPGSYATSVLREIISATESTDVEIKIS